VLLVLSGVLVVSVVLVAFERWDHALMGGALAAVLVGAFGIAWARKRVAINPSDELRERAARVAGVFPAAFIVMGHTHLPEVRPVGPGAPTYVNLGAWAEDDAPDGRTPALPASRTHLVIVHDDETPIAELLIWDSERGPRRFVSGYQPGETA
jgi:hypothetical protein